MRPDGSEAGWVTSLRRRYRGVDLSNVGVADPDIMIHDIFMVGVKMGQAKNQGFYVEAIDLTAHECEFLLMLWIAGVTRRPIKTARTTLGGWITEAEKWDFDSDLIRRLRVFNAKRGQAVNRLLRGEVRYADLADVLDADPRLIRDVARVALVNQGGQNYAARVAATLAASSAATRSSE